MSSPADDQPSTDSAANEVDPNERRPESPDRWTEVSADDRDEGWSERPSGYTDDWYHNERPPHHG